MEAEHTPAHNLPAPPVKKHARETNQGTFPARGGLVSPGSISSAASNSNDGGPRPCTGKPLQSKRKYHRTAIACLFCRKRKIKCEFPLNHTDSLRRCTNCVKYGLPECRVMEIEHCEPLPAESSSTSSQEFGNAPTYESSGPFEGGVNATLLGLEIPTPQGEPSLPLLPDDFWGFDACNGVDSRVVASNLDYSIPDLAPSGADQASLHAQSSSGIPTLSHSPSDQTSQLNMATYADAQWSPQAPSSQLPQAYHSSGGTADAQWSPQAPSSQLPQAYPSSGGTWWWHPAPQFTPPPAPQYTPPPESARRSSQRDDSQYAQCYDWPTYIPPTDETYMPSNTNS